jgi:hypothetical protein
MRKVIRNRAKRAKNGTTTWKLSVMNTKTGKVVVKRARGTYDELTEKVERLRSRNRYNSICAEEMHTWGGKVLDTGRVLTLDSLEDERMFIQIINEKTNVHLDPTDEFDDGGDRPDEIGI